MTGRSRTLLSRSWMWWIWLGYWACLFAATHTPVPARVHLPIPWLDKVIHFGLYLLLVLLGGLVWMRPDRRLALSTILAWSCLYAVYGAVDEWLQELVGRTMSLDDWLADVSGIVVGSLVLIVLTRRPPPVGS